MVGFGLIAFLRSRWRCGTRSRYSIRDGFVGSCDYVQSCVKTFLLSSENHSQYVLLPTPKLHYGTFFQPAIPETWQECFYTTPYVFLAP